jgi:UDP-N-acetylmuramate--alanine ligase
LGIEKEKIRNAVASFRGVRRRFEYVLLNERFALIDDYAHHPEELRALISSAKALFPDRHCTVIFQPHLFSRTRDLADGFAESLDLAGEVVLLPIYPARELPVAGVTSEMILQRMKGERKGVMEKDAMLKWMELNFSAKHGSKEVIIMAGAGDIDTLVQPVKGILEH